jgi:WhiB family redox-sensing transcriptional regulator
MRAGLSPLTMPCTEEPELFFAESPQDVEQAKALCRGCQARLACLAGALERSEPWGVWGGELLMRGAIVPGKRARGRPRQDVATIGAAGATSYPRGRESGHGPRPAPHQPHQPHQPHPPPRLSPRYSTNVTLHPLFRVYCHFHPLNSHLNVTHRGADEETAAHVTACPALKIVSRPAGGRLPSVVSGLTAPG